MRLTFKSGLWLLQALFCLSLSGLAQVPTLSVTDKDGQPVYLKELKADVQVTGSIARTTLHMTFFNPTPRILEGTLTLPLPEGVSVSRYALDINGKMREAVPIDKNKGTEVFEAIQHRRVDPGLLEKVDGNNFRTRIYPIPANGQRTIIIGYEQELTIDKKGALRYYLPFNHKKVIPSFELNIHLVKPGEKPLLEESPEGIDLEEWQQDYCATVKKENFKPDQNLVIRLPKKSESTEVLVQESSRGHHFMINLYPKGESRPKAVCNDITVFWDVSFSGMKRNIKEELILLAGYLKKNSEARVHLYALNHRLSKVGDYDIKGGVSKELLQTIERFTYDGGTDLSALRFTEGKEFLLFSDGLSTTGQQSPQWPALPIFPIASTPTADFSMLQFIARQTGGRALNLNGSTAMEQLPQLLEEPYQFLGIEENADVEDVLPSGKTAVWNGFSVSGVLTNTSTQITLLFGYGNTVVKRQTIELNTQSKSIGMGDLERFWAQKKIAELDIRYQQNKTAIEQLGKQYSIVTRNTSLIVLETVQDYVQYEVEPPAELRAEFDRMMKQRGNLMAQNEKVVNRNAEVYFGVLKEWFHRSASAKASADGEGIDDMGTENTATGISPVTTDSTATVRMNGVADPPARMEEQRRAREFQSRSDLQEVVVVGYASARRKDVTGSVSTVRGNQLSSSNDALNVLEGRAAGVMVQRSNTNNTNMPSGSINIRGVGSFTGNQPQVIIDGRYATVQELKELNSFDIESIEIQKQGYYLPPDARFQPIHFQRKDPNSPKINWRKIHYISDTARAIFKPLDLTPKTDYIRSLAEGNESGRYMKYLSLRKEHMNEPPFYFNTASWFFENDDYETALTILLNLLEMDFQDHELYKMVGYKLREMGEYQMALQAFRKVLEWRPMEPQSYRDYGLALQDAGFYQQALDTMYLGMRRNYNAAVSGLYPGIEEMMVTEINQLLALHGKQIKKNPMPKTLIQSMPMGMRVVLNWNKNDTDMDLWVTDPNGEKTYYGHKNSQIGGRISNDFTRGYGPEQFLLRSAIAGRYRVELNFYGETQFKLSGPTTVQAEIFLHYGTPNQQRQLVTLQMAQNKGQGTILVGSFEVGKKN